MKALSVEELQNLALELKTFEGARLQETRMSGSKILFSFYTHGEILWWVCDLHPVAPQVVCLDDITILKLKDEKKPLALFLRAHFWGRHLQKVSAPLDLGRVLVLDFGEGYELELRLFPRGQNALVRAGGKEIAMAKPQELKPLADVPTVNASAEHGVLAAKTHDWLVAQGLIKVPQASDDPEGAPATTAHEAARAKQEAKLRKALERTEADVVAKRAQRWSEAGDWLKLNGRVQGAPPEFADFIDEKKKLSVNIENCFRRAKEIKEKIVGGEKRVAQLRKELDAFLRGDPGLQRHDVGENTSGSKTALRKMPEDVKGRTHDLGGGLSFFIGKSAHDNLKLLRSSKAWDLWLHLRDVPSAHGILRRNKNQKVSDQDLHEAAHHLIAKNFGDKHKDQDGEKFDVLVAECRFVRPIKGDRIGRVTYSNERVFTHRYSKK